MLLPRSGLQALIGQSCQKGADLAPELLRQLLGVDIELMNADTESNVDTARTRAERLIEEGAHVLVGAFDSGHTAAIAQVAEQRGVPLIVNIAAAPQITEQGYKFVFRNFPTAPEIGRNGLVLIGDIFREAKVAPKTAVFMHVNDTFGQSMAKGVAALLPKLSLPFKLARHHLLRSGGQGPDGRGVEGEGDQRRLPAAGLSPERRHRPAARDGQAALEPDGRGQPRLARPVRGAVQQGAGQARRLLHLATRVWFNPKNEITHAFAAAFKKQNPKDEFAFHGINAGYTFDAILIAADAFKRAKTHRSEGARRGDPADQHPATDRVTFGGPIKFNAKGQVEGNRSVVIQNLNGKPTVVLPKELAEGEARLPDAQGRVTLRVATVPGCQLCRTSRTSSSPAS